MIVGRPYFGRAANVACNTATRKAGLIGGAKKKKMLQSKKFIQRLRDELHLIIPDDAQSVSTRAGRHGRAAGAWSSIIKSDSDILLEIGLYQPISVLMKCPNLAIENSWGQARIRSISVDCNCKGKCKGIAPQNNAEGVAVQQATTACQNAAG